MDKTDKVVRLCCGLLRSAWAKPCSRSYPSFPNEGQRENVGNVEPFTTRLETSGSGKKKKGHSRPFLVIFISV